MSIIKPRTATVTIYGGDYLDRIRHLERQAEAAQAAHGGEPASLSEEPEYMGLARQHDELVREAEESALHIVVGALPRGTWRQLVADHPPRKVGVDGATEQHARQDAVAGVNELSFRDALVPLSIVSPDLSADDLDALSDIDFERLYLTAFALNRAPVSDPKASLVSRLTPRSDEI